jgi:hypothetical protein
MRTARADDESGAEQSGGWVCPSAQPDEDAMVMGIVRARRGDAAVTMLPRQVPLEAIAHLLPPSIPATDMVRLGAPCTERRCGHFEGGRCGLAARVVAALPDVAEIPACSLRLRCQWWRQEGAAVCRRCPQITENPSRASDLLRRVASPALAPPAAA